MRGTILCLILFAYWLATGVPGKADETGGQRYRDVNVRRVQRARSVENWSMDSTYSPRPEPSSPPTILPAESTSDVGISSTRSLSRNGIRGIEEERNMNEPSIKSTNKTLDHLIQLEDEALNTLLNWYAKHAKELLTPRERRQVVSIILKTRKSHYRRNEFYEHDRETNAKIQRVRRETKYSDRSDESNQHYTPTLLTQIPPNGKETTILNRENGSTEQQNDNGNSVNPTIPEHCECDVCTLVEWWQERNSYVCINSIGDWGCDCTWTINKDMSNYIVEDLLAEKLNWKQFIDINKYLGDFSLLNTQFGRLYEFVNASWYWGHDDDPISPRVTFERFEYVQGNNEIIGYMNIQCYITRFDFEKTLDINWFNETYHFEATNDIRMNVDGNITLKDADALVFNYVCWNFTCHRQLLGLTSNVIEYKDMLQNITNKFNYANYLNYHINEHMQYCRMFHIAANVIDNEKNMKILRDDDINNLNYLGIHILQKHYATLIEMYSRNNLDTIDSSKINDPLTRGVFDMGREIIALKEKQQDRPDVGYVKGTYDAQFSIPMTSGGACEKTGNSKITDTRWKTQLVEGKNLWRIKFDKDKVNNFCQSTNTQYDLYTYFHFNDGCYSNMLKDDEALTPPGGCITKKPYYCDVDKWDYIVGNTKFIKDPIEFIYTLDATRKIFISAKYEQRINMRGDLPVIKQEFEIVPGPNWNISIFGTSKKETIYFLHQGYIIEEFYLLITDALNTVYDIDDSVQYTIQWLDNFDNKPGIKPELRIAYLNEPRPAIFEYEGITYNAIKFKVSSPSMEDNIIGWQAYFDWRDYPMFQPYSNCREDLPCIKVVRQTYRYYHMTMSIGTSGWHGIYNDDWNKDYQRCFEDITGRWTYPPPAPAWIRADSFITINDDRWSNDVPFKYTFNITSNSNKPLAKYSKQGSGDRSIERYSSSENDIYNTLKLFDQRLTGVENALEQLIDIVEEISTPEEDDSPWTIIELAFSLYDMGDLIYNASKYVGSLIKKSYQFIKGKIKITKDKYINIAKYWAQAIQKKLKEKSLRHITDSGAYSPLHSIEKATIFNYVGNYRLKTLKDKNIKLEDRFSTHEQLFTNIGNTLRDDIISISQLNAAAYLHMQKLSFSSMKDFKIKFNIPNEAVPFGAIFVHSSPIDIISSIGGKYLSDKFSKEVNNVFLSNHNVKYPFHTSFSSFNIEAKDREMILVRRFGGISEASTVGPTNIKNPKIKIGIIRFEYNVKKDGSFDIINWKNTYKYQGEYYTEKDVDELFRSFTNKNTYAKYSKLSTDDKWNYLIYATERQYSTRDIIDGIPIANPIYISQLDRLFDYNQHYNNFNYNLLTRNCQSFVKAYIELATKGLTSRYIKDNNFEDFVRKFQQDVERYLRIPIAENLVSKVKNFVNKLYNTIASFQINI